MIKDLLTIFAVALMGASCSHGVSRVQTSALPALNPITYTFPLSLEEVRTRALQAFSIEHQTQQPIFGRPPSGADLESIFSAESATNAVFGAAVFRDPANKNDIYLHTSHMPFVISPVYTGSKGGLPFIATFHLHLTAVGSSTMVAVTASDTQVVNGTKFGVGPCGPGQGWNYESVRPTTVEEYSILQYIGRHLGITNMPAIVLPTQ